jgi:5-methyltetrahydrofolate--homocysteine methyltransferase
MELLAKIAKGVIGGAEQEVATLTEQATREAIEPTTILDEGLIAGMEVVGERYKKHEIFLPEVLMAAKAMHAGMDVLEPLLANTGAPRRGRVVIGTVQGDLHDIGKNLVGIILSGAGFDVIDLGNDVAPEQFVDTAVSEDASVIGMSALLTTTMPVMKRVVDCVAERGLRDKIKVIVGGAPVSEAFAREIGADAYGFDASNAVDRIRGFVGA